MAAAMGVQNATLRRAGGLVVRTTFITGMLVGAAEQTAAWLLWKLEGMRSPPGSSALPRNRRSRSLAGKRAAKFFAVWSSLFLGATLGGFLAIRWGLMCLLAPLGVLLAIIAQDLIAPLSPPPEAAR